MWDFSAHKFRHLPDDFENHASNYDIFYVFVLAVMSKMSFTEL